jgi:hypothetical protein
VTGSIGLWGGFGVGFATAPEDTEGKGRETAGEKFVGREEAGWFVDEDCAKADEAKLVRIARSEGRNENVMG